jgi:hypothetical protein
MLREFHPGLLAGEIKVTRLEDTQPRPGSRRPKAA